MESWLCKQRREDRWKEKNEVEIQKARKLLPKEWEICRKQGWEEMESYLSDPLHLHMCLVTQSCLTLWNAMDCSPPGSSVHGGSPGKHTGVGCHALPPGDLPNPGIEPRSPALQEDLLLSEPPGKPCTYSCFNANTHKEEHPSMPTCVWASIQCLQFFWK